MLTLGYKVALNFMSSIDHITHLRTKKPLTLEGSVALVGSSDLLSNANFGTEIDGHDHVFRFNLARLEERYEAATGSKADFYLICPKITTIDYPHPEPLQTLFKNICRKSKVICYPGHTDNVAKFNKRPYVMDQPVATINEIFGRILGHTKWYFPANNHPRNGIKLLACLLAAGVTPKLYGFDFGERENNTHYYDDEKQIESKGHGHKPSIEYGLLNELRDKQLISARE